MNGLELFENRLKQLRLECGLTQREMAESIGITAASLSAYENGTKNPSLGVAIAIADKYRVSLDWLAGLTKGFFSTDSDCLSAYEQALNAFIFLFDQDRIITADIIDGDAHLYIRNHNFNRFVTQAYQFQGLFWSGSIDPEVYIDCIKKLVDRYARLIRNEICGNDDNNNSSIDTDDLLF